MAAVPLFMK